MAKKVQGKTREQQLRNVDSNKRLSDDYIKRKNKGTAIGALVGVPIAGPIGAVGGGLIGRKISANNWEREHGVRKNMSISAFGVEHGEISKSARREYDSNKKKGNVARNVALGATGVGAVNLGAAVQNEYKNSPLMRNRIGVSGKAGAVSEAKYVRRAVAHRGVGLASLGAVGGGLIANSVYRSKQRKTAERTM